MCDTVSELGSLPFALMNAIASRSPKYPSKMRMTVARAADLWAKDSGKIEDQINLMSELPRFKVRALERKWVFITAESAKTAFQQATTRRADHKTPVPALPKQGLLCPRLQNISKGRGAAITSYKQNVYHVTFASGNVTKCHQSVLDVRKNWLQVNLT